MSSTAAKIKSKVVDLLPAPVVFRIAPVLYRRQEPELARIRSYVPATRTAIDIGGWLGPWTRELARWCPHVHTFEPQPDLASYLRRVVPKNVTVHEKAVADKPGVLPLVIPSAEHGSRALASLGGDAGPESITHQVDVVRLDDMGFTDIGFVKIDVEGHEREVIEGADALLAEQRPRLLLEAEQRHIHEPITDLFGLVIGHGYDGWFLQDDRWNPLADFDVERHQLAHLDDVNGDEYINNFLFMPAEDGGSPPPS